MGKGEVVDPTGFRAAGTGWMIAGSVGGAVAAYLFLVLVGRGLGNVAFAPINAQWTVLFLTITIVFVPLEQFATREAAHGRDAIRADRRVMVAVGLGAAVIVSLVLWALASTFFDGKLLFVGQMALAAALYAVFFMVKGQAFGQRRFAAVGTLMMGEGALRLAVAIGLVAVFGTPEAVGWSFCAGPMAFLLVRTPTPVASVPLDRTTGVGGFLSSYVWASGASQLLLAGAPVVVGLLGAGKVVANVVFQTFTLFRAPLSMLYAIQGRFLSAFLRFVDSGASRSLRTVGAVLGSGGIALILLGTLVGAVIGPEVVALLFGQEFAPAADIAALAAGGVVAAFIAQIGGQILIAQARAARLAAAWTTGVAIAALILLIGAGDRAELEVAWAFYIGEIAAFCVVILIVLIGNRPLSLPGGEDGLPGAGVVGV